jgi:Ni/Co efflux regulator RcnB
MKKQILALIGAAAVLLPVAAQARTSHYEIRHDNREIREERRDLYQARRHGSRADIREARSEYRDARHELREDLYDRRHYNNRRHHDSRRYHGYRGSHFQAPFRYNHFNTGFRISPVYYSSGYHMNNYGYYRLPAPHYGYRYVRHYDDLLLVNVRNGYVARVYRGFYY